MRRDRTERAARYAHQVAVEHALWAAERGRRPREVIASLGRDWPVGREPTWDDVVLALSIEWRRCRRTF